MGIMIYVLAWMGGEILENRETFKNGMTPAECPFLDGKRYLYRPYVKPG